MRNNLNSYRLSIGLTLKRYSTLETVWCEIFAESPYLDSERCVCLSSALDQRIERLEGLALTMNHEQHHSPKIEEEFEIKLDKTGSTSGFSFSH